MMTHAALNSVAQNLSVGTDEADYGALRDAHKEGDSVPSPVGAPSSGVSIARKVLIVEDAIELAEVIAATLERVNIQTFHETHVERALEVFCSQRPDLILLDISLPDKTGWKLLDEIKARESLDQPIVVVISAHGDPANRLMGKLQGVHSYLVKPFTPDEVEEIVEKAFRGGLRRCDVEVSDADGSDGSRVQYAGGGMNHDR